MADRIHDPGLDPRIRAFFKPDSLEGSPLLRPGDVGSREELLAETLTPEGIAGTEAAQAPPPPKRPPRRRVSRSCATTLSPNRTAIPSTSS